MIKFKRQKDLTQGPLLPQIIMFSLPLIATSILQLLFNTADTIVVGRWGGDTPEECEVALAAVGSCGSLITLFVNLFLGLSVGAGIVVAHDIGAKRENEVQKTVHTSVITALAAGALVTVLGFLTTNWALRLMGTDESVLPEATKYIYAYFCGMPANMLYNYCASILRSKGDTVRPLIFLSIAGVANVIMNLVAVLVFDWGAMGVGAATAVSQWVSCILIVVYMMHMEGPCRIELSKLRLDLAKFKRILFVGLPAGLQSMLFSISNILIQSSVNSFGPTIVAANTTASNLNNYIYASQNSLYHTALTFVAQNAGAKNYNRMKQSALGCVLVVIVVGLGIGTLMHLFSDALLGIFSPDNPEVIMYAQVRHVLFCFTYFLCGIMEVGTGMLRGLGKSFVPMIISLIGSCVLRIVWIYTVFAWLPVESTVENTMFRMNMLYVSYPITWIITSVALYIMAFFEFRKFKREHNL
ncbi:MAG: MATE family efflux transporter [Clostridia bacterium]|nr:MATE family efflux transporter [Clostridia bacterium]